MESKKIKTADGTTAHYVKNSQGKLIMHNWSGPALVPQGNKDKAEYYLFGIKYDKDEWKKVKKNIDSGNIVAGRAEAPEYKYKARI